MVKLADRPSCPEAYKEGMTSASAAKSNNPLSGLFAKGIGF